MVVILTPDEARRRAQAAAPPAPTPWCSCPLEQPCECGNEAPLVPNPDEKAGWAVAR